MTNPFRSVYANAVIRSEKPSPTLIVRVPLGCCGRERVGQERDGAAQG